MKFLAGRINSVCTCKPSSCNSSRYPRTQNKSALGWRFKNGWYKPQVSDIITDNNTNNGLDFRSPCRQDVHCNRSAECKFCSCFCRSGIYKQFCPRGNELLCRILCFLRVKINSRITTTEKHLSSAWKTSKMNWTVLSTSERGVVGYLRNKKSEYDEGRLQLTVWIDIALER